MVVASVHLREEDCGGVREEGGGAVKGIQQADFNG